MRVWPFGVRSNQTCRPTPLDLETDFNKNILDISESQNPWNVFLECVPPDSGLTALPAFDKDSDVLLFFKLYDPQAKRIYYCGHHYMPVVSKVRKYQCGSSSAQYFLPFFSLFLVHFYLAYFAVTFIRKKKAHV